MQSLEYLTQGTRASFVGPLRVVLQRMELQLDVNPELLTDGGRDRMFQAVSYALSRINALLARATTPQEADEQASVPACFVASDSAAAYAGMQQCAHVALLAHVGNCTLQDDAFFPISPSDFPPHAT